MSRTFCWLGGVLLALTLVACGPEHVQKPTAAAPSSRRENDTIPGDLDVALRIDLRRIRSVLGDMTFEALRARAKPAEAGGDPATERLLAEAVGRADVAIVALRPADRADQVDSVLVLRGRFDGLEPAQPGRASPWELPQDLGAGWRRYDRKEPAARAAPARIYSRHADTLVFVSSAELDSVERQLEQGVGDPHVDPAEQGVISLDARAPALGELLDDRAPRVASLLRSAKRLRLHGDLDSVGLSAELELELANATGAKETAASATELLHAVSGGSGLVGRVTEAVQVEAVERRLVARVTLPSEVLAALLECSRGGVCE
jgi:hypothetical protein